MKYDTEEQRVQRINGVKTRLSAYVSSQSKDVRQTSNQVDMNVLMDETTMVLTNVRINEETKDTM